MGLLCHRCVLPPVHGQHGQLHLQLLQLLLGTQVGWGDAHDKVFLYWLNAVSA
jgi:hypothetical protein